MFGVSRLCVLRIVWPNQKRGGSPAPRLMLRLSGNASSLYVRIACKHAGVISVLGDEGEGFFTLTKNPDKENQGSGPGYMFTCVQMCSHVFRCVDMRQMFVFQAGQSSMRNALQHVSEVPFDPSKVWTVNSSKA